MCLLALSFFLLIIILIITLAVYIRWNRKSIQQLQSVESMFIFGSGGHTAEMCQLLKSLDPVKTFAKVHFVIARNDKLSLQRITSWPGNNVSVHLISRSRSVGQSWFTSLFTFAISAIESVSLIIRTQPHLIISNGPGTCVPICLAAKLLPGKRVVIFVESICRVKSLSLSGKILYPLVDRVVVQWPQLAKSYPKADYLGAGLI